MMQVSIESEMRMFTKELADEKAIQVFAENLRELLLASPEFKRTFSRSIMSLSRIEKPFTQCLMRGTSFFSNWDKAKRRGS